MENLDEEAAGKFINALIKSLQTLCHGYLNFHDGIEIIGHINLSVDRGSRLHYILEEKVCKNEENSTLFISNSFFAQNQKSDQKTNGKDPQCKPSGNQAAQRCDSADSEACTVSSAVSSITTALTVLHDKSRSGSSNATKDPDSSHSKHNAGTKRKASEDHCDVRTVKSSHLSSSPSPVSHFLSGSPHVLSDPSSPSDSKLIIGRHHSDTQAESDGGDGDLNLAGSVLECVDDHSNSDLPHRAEDSDGDLEVTFIKEEYVEGEQSSCQYENSAGQQGRGGRHRGTAEKISDSSLYPLHAGVPATFVPGGTHDITAQHYGPSTSSQPQPGTSGAKGLVPVTNGDGSVIMNTLEGLGRKIKSPQGPNNPVIKRLRQQPSTSGILDNKPVSCDAVPEGRSSGFSPSGRQIYTCQYCRHSYHAINSLRRHIKQVHFNTPTYSCELCGVGFMFRDHYTGHMNKHYGTPTFECDKCGHKFTYKADLYRHKKTCDGTPQGPGKVRPARSLEAIQENL